MKKVGKLNGKVVVAGDKNLVTANQIHYEEKDGNITLSERKGGELNSVTGSGSSGGDKKSYYYKVIGAGDDNYLYAMELIAFVASIETFIVKGCLGHHIIYNGRSSTAIGGFVELLKDGVTIDGFSISGKTSVISNRIETSEVSWAQLEGNLIELCTADLSNPEENQYLTNLLNSVVKEITEEEYKTLITVPPIQLK